MTSFQDNTQITSVYDFDSARVKFGAPIHCTYPIQDGKKGTYYRIPVGVENEDGSTGELVFATDTLTCFGVQEQRRDKQDPNSAITGYSLGLALWDLNGATPAQEAWLKAFSDSIESCKQHVLEIKKDVEQYDLVESDLRKFSPLAWRREKGEIVPGKGPALFPKLIASKKEHPPRILTAFYNSKDEAVDARDFIKTRCKMRCAIKIESIYCGGRVSPQIKVVEAVVEHISEQPRRFLTPGPKPTQSTVIKNDTEEESGSVASDSSSDEDESETEEVAAPPVETKKAAPVKKKTRVVVRKKKVPST